MTPVPRVPERPALALGVPLRRAPLCGAGFQPASSEFDVAPDPRPRLRSSRGRCRALSRGLHGGLPGVLALLLAGWATGCRKAPESVAPTPAGGRLFAVTFQTMNNPFFVDLNEGLRRVIEAKGDRLVTLDAQFNSLKQKNDIADLLQQQPAALFINPVNWEGIKGSLIEAQRKNVPAIIVDAPVSEPDLVLCQVASDNVEAGRLACEALARVNPKAQVVILHLSVNKACIDRVAGFRAEAGRHPDLKILDTQEGKGTTEGARPVMRDLLARFPEMDAAFPINDPSALGCLSAIESAGKSGQVTVVSVDGSREGISAVKAGRLHSTSAQFPAEIGRVAAETAYEHLAARPVPKDIKIPVRLITRDNADEFLSPP
ncbi:MAG: sugar ABC transporter substrate-binding protein [Verrucomicrobiales bacterium]|nr:sugar ABC transporter substrate-binding protein [Verrucomicrobiales bacterium]